MAKPMEHAGRSVALVGSCDKEKRLARPLIFPLLHPLFLPKAWDARVCGGGR